MAGLHLAAQIPVAENIERQVPANIRIKLVNALDTLLVHISKGKLKPDEISAANSALTASIFGDLATITANEKQKEPFCYKPQLINLYPVGQNEYSCAVAYIKDDSLRAIFNFMAIVAGDKVAFSIPLSYLTRNWKYYQIGNVTYFYPDSVNKARAAAFDKNNSVIATKLGLQPEKLYFYLCSNYQDVSRLLGYQYNSEWAGITNEGYGVDAGCIFSIMHNEDFSHDLFHYYSAKIRTKERNSAAEEGIAYSWGNAYYADENGEMITQQQLVKQFKLYVRDNPNISYLELFRKNPPVFESQAKVRALIASLICDEVERQKGVEGIEVLINCGRGDDNFFTTTNNLIGLNRDNFNAKVAGLLNRYQ